MPPPAEIRASKSAKSYTIFSTFSVVPRLTARRERRLVREHNASCDFDHANTSDDLRRQAITHGQPLRPPSDLVTHLLQRIVFVLVLLLAPLRSFADPLISEFLASNSGGLADDDSTFQDWIEIYNPDATPADLGGWYLTDNAANKTKWQFPAVSVAAKGYLVVFASGKNRRDPAKPLHTNFSLAKEGEYLALVKPDGVTAATEFAPTFPAQSENVSYGYMAASDGTRTLAYFQTPTPGAANVETGNPTPADSVVFSRASGIFSQSFTVTLSGAGAGEHIRYVAVPVSSKGAILAKEPTAASPLYSGPLTISESMIIRATVFSADDLKHGPSTTVHYLNTVTTGPARVDTFTSALPQVVIGLHGYGALNNNGEVIPGWVHLFLPGTDGKTFTSAPIMSSAAALNVRGNSSSLFPKKSYNADLVASDGEQNSQPLLGLASNDGWALVSPWCYDRAYVRNAFMYSLSNSIGRWAPRTRFVEVFFDGDGTLDAGDYAGVSLLTERIQIDPDRVNIANLSPTDVSGSAVTGGYLLKIDVNDADHFGFVTDHGIPNLDSASVIVVNPKAQDLPQAQRDYIRGYVQTTEDALFAGRASGWHDRTYLDYVDLPSWVDHHLLEVLSGNIDALSHSDYFSKDRGGKIVAGPLWDFDRAMNSYDARTLSPEGWNGGPVDVWAYGWYGVLATDPEFMQAWVDRWQSLRQNELADSALGALADSLAAEVTPQAAARDAARWPDNLSPTGSGFAGEISRIKDWLARHASWIDRQFLAQPGVTDDGATLTFTPPADAQLAYTLDGSDPRSYGGEIAPNAQLTSSPVKVPATANVHVRSYRAALKGVFPGSPWSSAVGSANSSPLAPKSRLINISARGVVGTGENALITGVVVADTAGKSFLARAVGPTLASFGASGVVPDPQLGIFNQSGVEIYRDNGWETATTGASQLSKLAKSVGAFPLTSGSADSAIAANLNSTSYTVQVTTPSGRSGIGLAELYELDANGRTLNLSTRAQVGTGDGVLIGGFVVQGTAYKRMLIRAVGPTLTAFGVTNELQDPVLTIYSGQQVVAANDRWTSDNGGAVVAAASSAVGAFGLAANSEDAAVLVTLPPGSYTVEVKGKAGGTGVALLEIYEVP
jgi:hypothetical protein